MVLRPYLHANFITDVDTRRIGTGYMMNMTGGSVRWAPYEQKRVPRSTEIFTALFVGWHIKSYGQ